MDESISPARKHPVPINLWPDEEAEWLFDVGDGLAVWSLDRFPEPWALKRVRTPTAKAKSRHVPVYAFSMTTQTHLHLESGLEHDLVRELDRQPGVGWLVAQPCKLRLPAKRGGRRVEHTPDLLTQHEDGAIRVWDARPESKQDHDFQAKSRLTAEACAQVNWEYEVFSGMPRPRRVNLLWLHSYRRPMPWYSSSLSLLTERFSGSYTIEQVLNFDLGGGHIVSAMWHGIWSGVIGANLDMPFTKSTKLWSIPERADDS